MEYRRLGKSGLKVSSLSFGSWVTFSFQLDTGAAGEMMKTAYDAGVNFFDNAEAYAAGQSEEIMGRVLKEMGWGRDTYCVSSKVFWGGELPSQRGLSRKHVFDACHAALRRLQVDYLDLYFCHRPDPEAPIAETVAAMDALVRQGKVLYWGTSEWSAAQIREAHAAARAHGWQPPSMEQPQYNLLHRERVELEYAPLYAEFGLGTTVWSPLASGLLTGKYDDGVPDDSRLAREAWLRDGVLGEADSRRRERARAFSALAADLGVAPAPLAIAWCLRNPHVSSVLLGATKVEQLLQNLEALELAGRFDTTTWRRVEAATAA